MRRVLPFRLLLRSVFPIATAALLAASCGGKKSVSGPPPPNDVTALVARADSAMEAALFATLTGTSPSRPSDLDFSAPHALYLQALARSPNHTGANFGAAATELLMLGQDAEVNAAFDEWDVYLRTHTPFVVPSARLRPLGVPLTFAAPRAALGLPFDLVPLAAMAPARATIVAADPQIDRVQAILRDLVLTRLTISTTRLARVAADPAFTFHVSGRMQGDPGLTAIEIDHTDILALLAAAELLTGACHVAVAYQLGFASYDSSGLAQALRPGSGWLALRSDGATHMQDGLALTLAALDDVGLSIASLRAETDPQDDDFIKTDPYDFTSQSLDSIQSRLPQIRQALTSGYTLTADWDGNSGTPDLAVQFRPGLLFTSPIADWKALLPPYAVTVSRRPFHTTFNSGGGQSTADVAIPADGSYSYNYSVTYQGGVKQYEYDSGNPELQQAVRQVVADQLAAAQAQGGWTGDFSGYASVNPIDLTAGTRTVSIGWQAWWSQVASEAFVPTIVWSADDFPGWIWPDPTLHGVLPGMSSTAQLLSTFGFDPSTWTKTLILDWTSGI